MQSLAPYVKITYAHRILLLTIVVVSLFFFFLFTQSITSFPKKRISQRFQGDNLQLTPIPSKPFMESGQEQTVPEGVTPQPTMSEGEITKIEGQLPQQIPDELWEEIKTVLRGPHF